MNKICLPRYQQDAIDLLIGELQQILAGSLDNPFPCVDVTAFLQQQLLDLKHLLAATEIIGMQALQSLWHWLANNIQRFLMRSHFSSSDPFLLDGWPAYLLDYLQQLREGTVCHQSLRPLEGYLTSVEWIVPMESVVWQQLEPALIQPDFFSDDTAMASRLPTIATMEMLSLELPDDLNPDLFEGLMTELPGQVNQFADAIESYLDCANPEKLLMAQRIAHTVKGSANIVGIIGLANFMHFCEDLLEAVARSRLQSNIEFKALLIDIVDTFESLLDSLSLNAMAGNEALRVMQLMLDSYHELVLVESQADDSINNFSFNRELPISPVHNHNVKISLAPDTYASDTDVFNSGADIFSEKKSSLGSIAERVVHEKTSEKTVSQLRIREETAQDLLCLAGSNAIANNRLQSQVQDLKSQLQTIAQLHTKLTSLADDFVRLVDGYDAVGSVFFGSPVCAAGEKISYAELHNFYQQLQEVVIDSRDATRAASTRLHEMDEQVWEQQRVHRESESLLLGMRMVSVSNMESRFQRCVRQANRIVGKQAELVIKGGETMIDSRVLHSIVDPLMHLLRNAVSHGIETAETRAAAGKPLQGHITLQFHNHGKTIVIDVIDDGAGLDYDAIQLRAVALGISPPPGDQIFSDKKRWLNQLIFSPGFSTYGVPDQAAGRGVGLDIVVDSIASLKGKVSVESSPGKGTHFTICLPVNLISEQGLVIRQGEQQWVISSRGVEQVLFLEAGQLEQQEVGWRYRFDDDWLNVYPIAALAKTAADTSIPLAQHRALLIIETWPGERVAVLIEQVLASKDMVFKPLTPYTPPATGVAGATILGDGQVAPVLDMQHLVLEALSSNMNLSESFKQLLDTRPQKNNRPVALVVDDSLSSRRALAQVVSSFGMEVHTAKDGFEAVDIMRDKVPDIVLLDMEMPRMNGLELTTHIRSNEPTRDVPVVMITSRNTDKYRHLAEVAGVNNYLSKPFSEDELVDYLQCSIRH